MPPKLKYLKRQYNIRKDIDKIVVFDEDRNIFVDYSVNKKKRWEPEQWEKPLVKVAPHLAININTGEKVIPPDNRCTSHYNTSESEVYYYYEDFNPKPDMIYNSFNFSGSHCLRITREERGRKQKERKRMKKDIVALALTD